MNGKRKNANSGMIPPPAFQERVPNSNPRALETLRVLPARGGRQVVGMTLIESTIVVSILSIFSIFLVNLVLTAQNAWLIQHAAVPVRAEAKLIMEAVVKELREGNPTSVIIPPAPNNSQISYQVPIQVTQAGVQNWRTVQLALVPDPLSTDPTLQQVTRTVDGVTDPKPLGRNVQSLTFTPANPANDVITVTNVTRVTTSGGLRLRARLTSQAKLRN